MTRGGGNGGAGSAYELLAPAQDLSGYVPSTAPDDRVIAAPTPPAPPRSSVSEAVPSAAPISLLTRDEAENGGSTLVDPGPVDIDDSRSCAVDFSMGPLQWPPSDGATGLPTVRPRQTSMPRATLVKRRRWVVMARVAVVVLTLSVVMFEVVVVRPWRSTQAGAHSGGHHRSALPFSSDPDTVQPPATADPAAPGQQVNSGEDQTDPFLLSAHGRFYLYTSGKPFTDTLNVPVASSTNFQQWSTVTDALPNLPAWVTPGFNWAPDVHQFGSTYVLYYTAHVEYLNEECIGAATSSSPVGPFAPVGVHPFICQSGLSGSIDPRVFTDSSGANWMLWKSDENSRLLATPTILWSQKLTPNGLGLIGAPSYLMSPDEPWQGTIVEAPSMVEVNGVYWLTYSGNWFNQTEYGIGVAWCLGPSGPCADLSNHALIASNDQGAGPGESSFYQDSTGVWMLYTPVMALWGGPPRPVDITRVGFTSDGAYLAGGGPPSASDSTR
jgi:hypothetical protein